MQVDAYIMLLESTHKCSIDRSTTKSWFRMQRTFEEHTTTKALIPSPSGPTSIESLTIVHRHRSSTKWNCRAKGEGMG